ncbi:MAG: dUTP diphosphatase [Bacteroidota bacterium]
MPLTVRISRTDPGRTDIPVPQYATAGSAGMDICAAVDQDLTVKPGETVLIPSGFLLELPQGYEGQVRPRSGLAVKHGIGILNSPGTIDSDYRGELKIILTNFGPAPFTIRRGDRIAQLVINKFERIQWEETHRVNETSRGEGGFGHTGLRNTDHGKK